MGADDTFYAGADDVDDLEALLRGDDGEEYDPFAGQYDEALAKGVEYADDADAVEFLQADELDLPAWKRRHLVRERMAAARRRAAKAAQEARVRQLVAAKRMGDHRGAEVTFASTADAAANIVDERTLRRGGFNRKKSADKQGEPVARGERRVTAASRKILRRMADDLLADQTPEDVALLAAEVDHASRARVIDIVVDSNADAWLMSISKYLVLVAEDRAAATRFRDGWLPSVTGGGTVGTLKSVVNQAMSAGITSAALVDAVRRAVQVILTELQELVPAYQKAGVPLDLYEEVVLVIGHAIMSELIEVTLLEG
jgi:hypothetical protein